MGREKLRDMALCALAAAILALCAFLAVPVGDVAITMQTFALFLILEVLGGRRGSIACGVYILMGAVGLPVFSGFRGGIGVLLGATGGYIWGFLATCAVYWCFTARGGSRNSRIAGLCVGLLSCYVCGTAWYGFAYGGGSVRTFALVVAKCVMPFLVPDFIKLVCALALSRRLKGRI